MKIIPLASGSKGNATYIETPYARFIVDLGVSYKMLSSRLSEANLSNTDFDAVFLTHEHNDHVSGLGAFLNRCPAQVFMSHGTYEGFHWRIKDMMGQTPYTPLINLTPIYIKDTKITPFKVSHDSKEPMGLVFETEHHKYVHITDTGYLEREYFPLLMNADVYLIEANHDPHMLMDSSRPFILKQRILGDKGHLSNQDTASALAYLAGEKTKHVICAHLSEECNDPEVMFQTLYEVLGSYAIDHSQIEIQVAHQHCASKGVVLK